MFGDRGITVVTGLGMKNPMAKVNDCFVSNGEIIDCPVHWVGASSRGNGETRGSGDSSHDLSPTLSSLSLSLSRHVVNACNHMNSLSLCVSLPDLHNHRPSAIMYGRPSVSDGPTGHRWQSPLIASGRKKLKFSPMYKVIAAVTPCSKAVCWKMEGEEHR